MTPDPRRRHWQTNLRWIGFLLGIGFVATFLVAFFARDLGFGFAGWPFSYWMGAQGAPLLYLVIVCAYVVLMERLDARCGVEEPPED